MAFVKRGTTRASLLCIQAAFFPFRFLSEAVPGQYYNTISKSTSQMLYKLHSTQLFLTNALLRNQDPSTSFPKSLSDFELQETRHVSSFFVSFQKTISFSLFSVNTSWNTFHRKRLISPIFIIDWQISSLALIKR